MTVLIKVKGAVQGVGYRPFILKKANEYGLAGNVKNIGAAVDIIVSGETSKIDKFAASLKNEHPAGAFILSVDTSKLSDSDLCCGDFFITKSEETDLSSELPVFLPDIGICDECTCELLNKEDRRYMYPLISCASCGPRISILDRLPYDRNTTAMSVFKMCPACSDEYKHGRRTHAQTISCHDCGPQMIFDYSYNGEELSLEKAEAVKSAVKVISDGGIIGLKGVSGFQLICRPLEESAKRLRAVKGRENKPFAVMFSDIAGIREYCYTNQLEEELLLSSARPIVLLKKKRDFPYEVSRDSSYIGAFLPSAGIHRIICDAAGPVICTSANRSQEPMITDELIFKKVFENDVDGVLYHKRKINMPQDDSVMFVIKHGEKDFSAQFIRRARGFAPLPIIISGNGHFQKSYFAAGGDLKSTFSIAKNDRIIPSQFIGDLENTENYKLFTELAASYKRLFSFEAQDIIADMHPRYFSAEYARKLSQKQGIGLTLIQHHHAHVLSVMAENSLKSCIGIAFDGTGYGTDHKIWGGEILYCRGTDFKRSAHLSYVKLCGGDSASKNSELVKDCYEYACKIGEIDPIIRAALLNNINTFETSSMGRLFDAVSALLGIKKYNSYEGECAILLEKKAYEAQKSSLPELSFKITKAKDGHLEADQIDFFNELHKCLDEGKYDEADIAYSFHVAVSKLVLEICSILKAETSEQKVSLSGGVFANRLLLTLCIDLLTQNGFEVFWNKKVPAGDAGISLGQAYYGCLRDN